MTFRLSHPTFRDFDAIVRDAIEAHLDMDRFEQIKAEEERDRAELLALPSGENR